LRHRDERIAGLKERKMTFGNHTGWLRFTALICSALIAPGGVPLVAQQPAPPPAAAPPAGGGQDQPKPKTPDQLDSLTAPIALYPDPLLAQVLAASTYPLEIVQADRWLKANTAKLKGEALTKEAAKQPWDPSVQALVAFPDALKFLDDNIQWTTELGNAFLDQQSDVMDSVQRMRKKAKDGGKLASSKEQKVEQKTVESKTVIVIEPANPEVIYVPSYQPTVVYGPPVVAYPPVVYPPPPSTGAIVATAAVSFGVGVMMGAFWSGCCHSGGWGWGCGWGGNNNVVINNNFNTRYGYNNINANRNNINTGNIGSGNRNGNNTWQHNPSHRGAVPYDNRATAQRFNGGARDAAGATQRYDRSQAQSRNVGGERNVGGDRGTNRANGAQATDRAGTNRAGGAQAADRAGTNRGQTGGVGGGGNQDRMGNRSVGSGDSGRQSAFSGSQSRERTQAASDRGFSSSRGSSGGSSARSSGGGGGRSRGGGGGRRR
jgi:hypothetical protein